MGCGGSVANGHGHSGMGRAGAGGGDDKNQNVLTSTEVQTISIKPGRSGDGGDADGAGGGSEVVSGRKAAGQSGAQRGGPAGAANGLTGAHGAGDGGSGTGSGKSYVAGTATVTGGGAGGKSLAPPDLPNTLGSPHGLVGQWNAAFNATGGGHIAAASTAGGTGAAGNGSGSGSGKDCVALFDARSPYHNPRYDVSAPHNSEFLSVLASDATRKLFVDFLAKSYCDFQITFCEDVQRFRQLCGGVGLPTHSAASTATTAATAAAGNGVGGGALTLALPSGASGGGSGSSSGSGVTDSAHDRAIRERADHIYAQYIRVGAPSQVNLIQSVKANIDMLFAASKQAPVAGTGGGGTAVSQAQPPLTARGSLTAPLIPGARVPVSVFDEAEFVILELVKGNFYFTFIKTPEYLRHQQQAAAPPHGRTGSLAGAGAAGRPAPAQAFASADGRGATDGVTPNPDVPAGSRDKGCVIA